MADLCDPDYCISDGCLNELDALSDHLSGLCVACLESALADADAKIERMSAELYRSRAENARLTAIESAARALFAAMDVLDPAWRAETFGLPPGEGDEANAAWDALAAAIGEGEGDVDRS